MKVKLKPGVTVQGITPEMLLGVIIAQSVYEARGESMFVLTSVTDGKHMKDSRHYLGDAVDLRLPIAPAQPLVRQLAEALGKDYDVVLEKTHIHVEYDPK